MVHQSLDNKMASTTNIHELPMNSVNNGNSISNSGNEVQMSATEPQKQMSLDQTTINQIVSGLQQASVAGITQLPSRDIPRSTEQLTHDAQVQPNYIQPATRSDYIKETIPVEEMCRQYEEKKASEKNDDLLYDELQIPIMLSILYFLFQLPILKKILSQYLPVLFSNYGNINLNGLGFMSIAYGGCYYFLNKAMIVLV